MHCLDHLWFLRSVHSWYKSYFVSYWKGGSKYACVFSCLCFYCLGHTPSSVFHSLLNLVRSQCKKVVTFMIIFIGVIPSLLPWKSPTWLKHEDSLDLLGRKTLGWKGTHLKCYHCCTGFFPFSTSANCIHSANYELESGMAPEEAHPHLPHREIFLHKGKLSACCTFH